MARAAFILIVMVSWIFVSGEGMAKKPPKDDTPPQEEITPLPEDVMPPPEGDIEVLRQENAQLQAEIDLLNDDIAQLQFVSADNKKVKAEKDKLAAILPTAAIKLRPTRICTPAPATTTSTIWRSLTA